MSNAIRYDPLLVHYLAAELNASLRERATSGAPIFAEDRSVTLPLDRRQELRLDLHPTRGWVRLLPADTAGDVPQEARIVGVSAPADERLLSISYHDTGRFRTLRRRLVVELHTNQWNAVVVDEENGRIVAALRTRNTGGRSLLPGQEYAPPPPQPRIGSNPVPLEEAWAEWRSLLGSVPPPERTRALVRHFAYTGTLNAPRLLGDAAAQEGEVALRAAFERWWAVRSLPPAAPVLLRSPAGLHPYPLPLEGATEGPVPTLLGAMERVATALATDADTAVAGAETVWLEQAERRWRTALRRAERLREQLSQKEEIDRLRQLGDLLLAHLAQVPRSAGSVRLPTWEGGEVEIPLDPALSPAENANRYYAEARRKHRAQAQIPALIAQAEAEAKRWESAIESLRQGEPRPGLLEELAPEPSPARSRGGGGETLPYRSFRTSGGLEVRVGRNSRENDRLTFGHSAPGDVWLHARSVPGSHIILRWSDPEAAPPARDLAEAAGLAAWFSKARTSGLVPVDWTRRKYVRKPRGAAPGLVIPQRVKTLFVEPDPELETRLRDES